MARRILGLDLGSHSVKAVELRQSIREVELVQMRALPLVDGTPASADELADFLRMHDLPVEGAVVSIPGDRVSSRRLSFPFRDRRKITLAVPFEVEAQVPFDLDDFFVDWEIVGETGGGCDVVATLAPRGEVAECLAGLREAKVDPRIVEAEGLLLANLGAFFELPEARLLADIGHRKTTVALLLDGRAVAARTIPVAGQALTRAIASERGTDDTEAERIKHEEGIFGDTAHPACPAAVGVVDRLARELARTLGSLEGALPPDRELGEVTLCGGSAHLHRLDEELTSRLGVPVRRLALPPVAAGTAVLAGGDRLLFAPAIALAARGSMRARTRMNLRQGPLAHRIDLRQVGREFRGPTLLAGVAFALAALTLGTQIGLESRRGEAVEAQAQGLYQAVFPGRPSPPSVVSAMQQAVGDAQNRADTLGVYRGNLSALDVLTEISARVPEDLEVILEELSIDRQVVQIKGHTAGFGSVDRLRAELAKYEPFSTITVGDITRDARRGGQTFNMRISLSSNGDAGS
jgi:type IV pilus assembly protein PilM